VSSTKAACALLVAFVLQKRCFEHADDYVDALDIDTMDGWQKSLKLLWTSNL
jgi:hypothetical protein